MTARQLRRAQEHAARKLARKPELASTPAAASSGIPSDIVAAARAYANRANAALSTGPRTETGKRIASRNALKTALTGQTVLLPEDDADRYAAHLARFRHDFTPATPREIELVQSLADTQWRLNRIPALEFAIYA